MPTSSPEDSPANPSAPQGNEKPKTTPDGSGPNTLESYAWWDPDTCSWKTSQVSLLPEWETYSETWPRQGMTRNGKAYQRQRLVPPISGGGSSLWPTPVAQDDQKTPEAHMAMKQRMPGGPRQKPTSLTVVVKGVERGLWPTPTVADSRSTRNATVRNRESEGHPGTTLTDAVEMWPTPTSSDGTGGPGSSGRDGGPNLRTATGGQLNPMWVEWLMGFPAGWTDLEDSETPSSPK